MQRTFGTLWIGATPAWELVPVVQLELRVVRLLAQLSQADGRCVAAHELVPRVGRVEVIRLDRMPAECTALELLDLASIEVGDQRVFMAISDTYTAWYGMPTVTGLLLQLAQRCFLYEGPLSVWPERLPDLVGPGTYPDLTVCPSERWALGIDHGTDAVMAVARW